MGTLQAQLSIYWNGISATDESAYLVSASGTFSFQAPADFLTSGGGTVNDASITLANAADRYITILSALDFFERKVELGVSLNGGAVQRIFTGVIRGVQLTAPNPGTASQIVLTCVTMESPYLQRKYDMPLSDFKTIHGLDYTESQFFTHILRDRLGDKLPRAFDPGLVILPWLWFDDESVLEELWKIAASCGGVLYTDINGVFTYKNASSLAKAINSPVETLSRTANSYGMGTLDVATDDLYSDVVIEVSTRAIGEDEELWSPEDYADLVVPPSGTLVVNATFDDPVYEITGIEWDARSRSGLSAVTQVTMSHVDYAQKCQITFTNASASEQAIIAFIRVHGYPVTGRTTFERTATSTHTYWDSHERRTRSLRSNAYVQTPVQGKYLADIILAESQSPRALVRLNSLPGLPSRFIGNVVRIQDTRIKTLDIVGQIESINWQLGQTYMQSIVVQDFGNVYPYTPYFTLDSPTLGVLCSNNRVFY